MRALVLAVALVSSLFELGCSDSGKIDDRARGASGGGAGAGIGGLGGADAGGTAGGLGGDTFVSSSRAVGATGGFGELPKSLHVATLRDNGERLAADGTLGVVVAESIDLQPNDGTRALDITRFQASGALDWAKRVVTGAPFLGGLVLDAGGNSYIAGSFSGELEVDGHVIASTDNPGSVEPGLDQHGRPSSDVFLLKLDRSGKVQFLERFGGVADQKPTELVRDSAGNLILVGNFTGKLQLGATELLSSGGSTVDNLFIARIDPQGKPLFAEQFEQGLLLTSATIDSRDDLILAGESLYGGGALFGDASLTVAAGGWLLKLDSSLSPVWAKGLDASSSPIISQVVVDHEDDLVVSGATFGAVDGPVSLFGTPIGDDAVVLAKLDPAGAPLFAHSYGSNLDYAIGAAVLSDDSIAFTGTFAQTIDFGGGELAATVRGVGDVFVARVDAQGNHLMSLRAGSTGSDYPFAIAATPRDTLVLSGYFEGSFDFGGGKVTPLPGPFVAWLEP